MSRVLRPCLSYLRHGCLDDAAAIGEQPRISAATSGRRRSRLQSEPGPARRRCHAVRHFPGSEELAAEPGSELCSAVLSAAFAYSSGEDEPLLLLYERNLVFVNKQSKMYPFVM